MDYHAVIGGQDPRGPLRTPCTKFLLDTGHNNGQKCLRTQLLAATKTNQEVIHDDFRTQLQGTGSLNEVVSYEVKFYRHLFCNDAVFLPDMFFTCF